MIDEVRRRAGELTYLAMFSYEVQRDGSLKAPPLDDIPNIASSAGVANALVVTNLENFAFSADLAHDIFTDVEVQNRLFDNLIQIANEIGYTDIHFDFEILHPEDRELYNISCAEREIDSIQPVSHCQQHLLQKRVTSEQAFTAPMIIKLMERLSILFHL